MKRQFIKLACIAQLTAAVLCLSSCDKEEELAQAIIDPEVTTTKPHTVYTPIWSEDFNGTSVDKSKWNFQTGTAYNNEKEYYQEVNATVSNGNLVITAKKELMGGAQYTSARLNTQNKFSVKYGRIEARIKLPMVQGTWPAFWMDGSNLNTVGWPKCGEIDIMEQVNAKPTIYATMHWDNNGHMQYGDSTTVATPNDYHVYAAEWDNTGMRWYVDDQLYCTSNTEGNVNGTEEFNSNPFFIILNVAVGGDFPGNTINDAGLPASMYVDYVRVYRTAVTSSLPVVHNSTLKSLYELFVSSGTSRRFMSYNSSASRDSQPALIYR